jgi:NAD(P)H-hydrate repair Nnr-like enzyme with NAD(P)H-hydrate dehydratase domain
MGGRMLMESVAGSPWCAHNGLMAQGEGQVISGIAASFVAFVEDAPRSIHALAAAYMLLGDAARLPHRRLDA